MARLSDWVRKNLENHDDPVWQKAVAMRVRHMSVALFIMLIARMPFSDDTTSLPNGLLDFYEWLEKAGGATKLVAASSESLVKPLDPSAMEDDGDELESIRIDPRDPDVSD